MRYGCVLPLAGMALFLAAWGLLGPYIDWHGKLVFAGNIALVLVVGGAALIIASRFGWRDRWQQALALSLPLFFVGCQAVTFPEFNFNVRVIVTIEANGQEITEEAVWNYVADWDMIPVPFVVSIGERFVGDALIYDIGDGRQLALTTFNGSEIVREGFMRHYEGLTGQPYYYDSDRSLGPLEIAVGRGGHRSALRFMVHISNLPDGFRQPVPLKVPHEFLYLPLSTSPKGWQWLNRDQLPELGVRLVRVEVERTSDPVTETALSRVSWLSEWFRRNPKPIYVVSPDQFLGEFLHARKREAQ
jgi:hypothetical protein